MDTESLLRSLNARDVQYVIIGATAFPVHGYARATLDIDVFIAATRENAERVRSRYSAEPQLPLSVSVTVQRPAPVPAD
jgi:predicted nucleotidyltransferase